MRSVTSASIQGAAEVGATLIAVAPTTNPVSIPIAYQWLTNGVEIPGATADTYLVPLAQHGSTLTVRVTTTAQGHQNFVSTSPGVVVNAGGALSLTPPTIRGQARVGTKLAPTVGQWVAGVTLSYQWLRNNNPIAGATAKTYTPTAGDLGARLSLAVTGSHPHIASVTVVTPEVTVSPGLLSTSTPTISGSAVPGKTLKAIAGAWTSGTAHTYQWYANGAAIKGATKTSFKVTSAQVGKKVTVAVTGKKSGYTTAVKTSAMHGVLKTATPKITGTAKVGKTLTAKPGTWTSGTKLTYQWYSNGKAIKGATAKTFKVTSTQRGKRITVTVTGKKSGYTTAVKTSARTKAVAR